MIQNIGLHTTQYDPKKGHIHVYPYHPTVLDDITTQIITSYHIKNRSHTSDHQKASLTTNILSHAKKMKTAKHVNQRHVINSVLCKYILQSSSGPWTWFVRTPPSHCVDHQGVQQQLPFSQLAHQCAGDTIKQNSVVDVINIVKEWSMICIFTYKSNSVGLKHELHGHPLQNPDDGVMTIT